MSSIFHISSISWLALLTLLAFLCSLQDGSNGVAEAFRFFKHKKARPYDDYDSSSDDHKETRRMAKLKAAAANWETFSKSPLFVEPVDEGLTQVPVKQLEFAYEAGFKNIALFKEIIREAIKDKDNFLAQPKLIAKYGLKIIQTMIQNRRDEMKIEGRYEPKNFFSRMADSLSRMVERSSKIVYEKKYNKKNVDVIKLAERANGLLDYALRILESSPVGVFLKWDTIKLYMDDPKHPDHKKDGMEECADVFAGFRAIGYDAAASIAKRIASTLKLFARGEIPKHAD